MNALVRLASLPLYYVTPECVVVSGINALIIAELLYGSKMLVVTGRVDPKYKRFIQVTWAILFVVQTTGLLVARQRIP